MGAAAALELCNSSPGTPKACPPCYAGVLGKVLLQGSSGEHHRAPAECWGGWLGGGNLVSLLQLQSLPSQCDRTKAVPGPHQPPHCSTGAPLWCSPLEASEKRAAGTPTPLPPPCRKNSRRRGVVGRRCFCLCLQVHVRVGAVGRRDPGDLGAG